MSALATLNIDDHNWISTSDSRLLRCIVRDYKSRGYSAQETINRWPRVRKGEEKWIFPYQENADAIFNSSIVCELAVMKQYALPILEQVAANVPEHSRGSPSAHVLAVLRANQFARRAKNQPPARIYGRRSILS